MDNDKKTSDVNELMTRLNEAAIHKLSVGNELKRQVIILMNEMNDDPERLLYGIPDKLPMWIQNVVSVCFSMKAERNPALKWWFSPGGCDDDESLRYLAMGIYHEPSMTKWVETVIDINTGIVDNLAQIDWQRVTSNWDDEVTEAIVMCLDGYELQMTTIDCILDVWHRESAKVINADTFNPKFEDFCLSLKRYLNNLSLYDIEAIRVQENEHISEPETQVKEMSANLDDAKQVVELVEASANEVKSIAVAGHPHFTPTLSREDYTSLFDDLKNEKYLSQDAELAHWLVICGIDEPTSPNYSVDWICTVSYVAICVDMLFGRNDGDRKWNIAESVFTVNGVSKKSKSLSATLSKYNTGERLKNSKRIKRMIEIIKEYL